MSFKPGQSGNPSGRPKRTAEEAETLDQIKRLSKRVPGLLRELLKTGSPVIKLKCIELILDRTYGKAKQEVLADIKTGIDLAGREVRIDICPDDSKSGTWVKLTEEEAAAYARSLDRSQGDFKIEFGEDSEE